MPHFLSISSCGFRMQPQLCLQNQACLEASMLHTIIIPKQILENVSISPIKYFLFRKVVFSGMDLHSNRTILIVRVVFHVMALHCNIALTKTEVSISTRYFCKQSGSADTWQNADLIRNIAEPIKWNLMCNIIRSMTSSAAGYWVCEIPV